MTSLLANINQIDLVKEIANRMRDPDRVKEIVLHTENCNPKPLHLSSSSWGGLSLAGGYAGILLLFAYLDRLFPEEKWETVVHAYVLKIKTIIETDGIHSIPLSLFGGIAGICFVLQQASREGTRYQRMIAILNEHLLKEVEKHYLEPLKKNLSKGLSSRIGLYDLIGGIVGIGIYGLNHLSDPPLLHLVEEIVQLLIGLEKPILVDGRWVPGWHASSEHQLLQEEKLIYSQGNFNLGLAHGVTGILGFLSVALLRGVSLDGQREAIERMAFWLQGHRKKDHGGFFWPSVITFKEEIAKTRTQQCHFSGRDAWCYGTPGVARTIFLAGKALKSTSLKTFAIDSFRSVFDRSREQWQLPGPTCCHGIAGLLLIAQQMAQDTQEKDLEDRVIFLNRLLLQFYHSEHPFGFTDYTPCQGGVYGKFDKAGLLEGASGILLTLLSLENQSSWWHAPFLVGHEK